MNKYNIYNQEELSLLYNKKNIEINIKANAKLNLFELIDCNCEANTIINLDKNAKLVLNRFCNTQNLDNKIEINLNGENSKVYFILSTISNCIQNIQININHNNVNTFSDITNHGITIDNGIINFNIITKIEKGNFGSTANQDSKIITMGSKSSGNINPILIINEHDVNARHSAYIGDFNKKEVFYLETRGISKQECYKLLVKGFLINNFNVDIENKNIILNMINRMWK